MPAVLEKRPSGPELAAMSWRSLRQVFVAMPLFYTGVFLIYGLVGAGLDAVTIYPPLISALRNNVFFSYEAFIICTLLLQSFLLLVVIAIAAVAIHRFILLDDAHPRIKRYTPQFFLWLVFVSVIVVPLDLMKILVETAMPDSGLATFIEGAVWILKVVVVIYFVLLFPSVAVGEESDNWRGRIALSAARMDGNFWLFLRSDILALLPLVLTTVLISLAVVISQMFAFRIHLSIIEVFRDLIGFPILMVQAAIASWLYAWVRQQPDLSPATDV